MNYLNLFLTEKQIWNNLKIFNTQKLEMVIISKTSYYFEFLKS